MELDADDHMQQWYYTSDALPAHLLIKFYKIISAKEHKNFNTENLDEDNRIILFSLLTFLYFTLSIKLKPITVLIGAIKNMRIGQVINRWSRLSIKFFITELSNILS